MDGSGENSATVDAKEVYVFKVAISLYRYIAIRSKARYVVLVAVAR